MGQTFFVIIMLVMIGTAIWAVVSIFSARVSEPHYERIALKRGYEIRRYDPFIEASTVVDGSYSTALYEGFQRIGGYIFGNNIKKQSIAMTAPVLDTALDGQKRRVSFVMPEGSKMDGLPHPEDGRVKLSANPAQSIAVLRFTGAINAKKIARKEAKLLAMLKQDNIKITDKPRSARYNPPWTFPLLARNEIHVGVQYKNT